jgi:serine/threonine protein kinase
MATQNQVFISYAHEDVAWRDEFTSMLKPAINRGSINLWSDANIPIGADWASSINDAISVASVGLLLVTPHFFDSEFITDDELGRLLNLAKTSGMALYWVPVSKSLFTETPLAKVQAAWDPETPLDQLSPTDRNTAVHKICTSIVEQFGFLPKVTGRRRASLPVELQRRLGDRYVVGDEIGAGRFSIVYRAQQKNPSRTVAVKLFVASEFDDWALDRFEGSARLGGELTSPAYVRILDFSTDVNPEYLISEFVEGERLSKHLLRYPEGLPLARVKSILLDLIRSLEELHQKGRHRGELYPSNIFIEPSGAARLFAVDLSTVLSEEARMAGSFSIDRESLAYMTPERFSGAMPAESADQFALGLVAAELLGGEPIPRVNCPRDLEDKRRLFEDLENAKGRWSLRSSEFTGVVCRLLRTDPQQRWPSMSDVRNYVDAIEIAESQEDRDRRLAKSIYLGLQAGGRGRDYFERFYRNLFAKSPSIAAAFTGVDMQRQHAVVNRAIQLLLDFSPAHGSVPLRDLAARHGAFRLSRRDYDDFVDVLVDTLAASGETDPMRLQAWRNSLAPGVEFMRTCQGGTAATEPRTAQAVP